MTDMASRPDDQQPSVSAVLDDWRRSAAAAAGGTALLYHRDAGRPGLDLTTAPDEAVERLLAGEWVEPAALAPDRTVDAVGRLRRWSESVGELFDGYGVAAGHLGLGMATWQDEPRPAAPILLFPARARTERFGDRLWITVDNTPVVNPALIDILATRYAVGVSADRFPIPDNANPGAVLDRVASQLRQAADEVPGFAIDTTRRVLGLFDLVTGSVCADLAAAATDPTAEHSEVLRRLVGHPAAGHDQDRHTTVPVVDPADEFAIADTDAWQRAVIDAVTAHRSVVVDAPPGTGTSQTIANLIVELAARGRRVLLASPGHRGTRDVIDRLAEVGLSDLVLDAHDTEAARHRVLASATTDEEEPAEDSDDDLVHRQLTEAAQRLVRYRDTVHAPRDPWGVSVEQLRRMKHGVDPADRCDIRLDADCLDRLTASARARTLTQLRDYARAGGFALTAVDTPWWGAVLPDNAATNQVLSLASLLARTWPTVRAGLNRLAGRTGSHSVTTLSGWRDHLDFLCRIRDTELAYGPAVWTAPLDSWIIATAPAKWRKDNDLKPAWLSRRRVLAEIRAQRQGVFDIEAAHRELRAAADQAARWRVGDFTGDLPFVPDDLDDVVETLARFDTMLSELAGFFDDLDTSAWSLDRLTEWLARLADDQRHPRLIQTLLRLRGELEAIGLGPLLDRLTERRADARAAVAGFEYVFATGLLDRLADEDPAPADDGRIPADAEDRYLAADLAHLRHNARRVRRLVTDGRRQARQNHPEAARYLSRQAGLRRNRAGLAELFAEAGELILADTPCVAMPPLAVGRLLPARRRFDVVVLEQAGRIGMTDAAGALLRGGTVVAFGDRRLAPPRSFPMALADHRDRSPVPDPGDAGRASGTAPSDPGGSAHAVLSTVLSVLPLRCHYRSRDERLIAFANRHLYDNALLTAPGIPAIGAVSLCQVTPRGTDGFPDSSDTEVAAVVDLVAGHARTRPGTGLGVVTPTDRHARRIRAALRRAARDDQELAALLDTDKPEPTVVTTIDRAVDMVRDTVIVSMGFHAAREQRPLRDLGPLSGGHGEELIATATTRARHRLVMVTGFGADEPDPAGPGPVWLVRRLVSYAARGGNDLTVPRGDRVDPFAADVIRHLAAAGIPVSVRHGMSASPIGLVAEHPKREGLPVLALETDDSDLPDPAGVRDRYRLRRTVLEDLGWPVHRVWSARWWLNRNTEIARVVTAWRAAVARVDATAPQPPSQRDPRTVTPPIVEPASGDDARTAPCPVQPGRGAITEYSQEELVSLIDWICADQQRLSDDELRRSAMRALGFKRRGSRIDAAIGDAVRSWRRSRR